MILACKKTNIKSVMLVWCSLTAIIGLKIWIYWVIIRVLSASRPYQALIFYKKLINKQIQIWWQNFQGLASHVQATARGKGKWLLRTQSLVSLVQSWRVEASLKRRIQSECGWKRSPAHISSVTGHFCITWFMLKEDYLFQRERKWRRIEEENRPERGELPWGDRTMW